jgi:hypothetical protein
LSKASATTLLENAGLKEADGPTAPSDSIASGSVISSKPSANNPAVPGSTVVLTLSSGPAPVKTLEVYPLPNGAKNAVAIVAALTPDTEFKFATGGDSSVIIFCQAQTCSAGDREKVRNQINALAALPESYAFSAQLEVPRGQEEEAANKVRSVYGPSIVSTPLTYRIRLASQVPIAATDLSAIRALIAAPARILAWDLPFFCLSGTLFGAGPMRPAPCTPPGRIVQASNAPAIVAALPKNPNFTVTAPANTRIAVLCTAPQGCSSADTAGIWDEVNALARPTPAYTQDIEVPFGAGTAIAKNLNTLNIMGITADLVGTGRIRLKSDAPVSEDDVNKLKQQFIFAPPAPPAFRMFYQDPTLVLPAFAPPASPASSGTPAASPAPASSSPPTTSATPAATPPSTTITSSSTSSSSTPAAPSGTGSASAATQAASGTTPTPAPAAAAPAALPSTTTSTTFSASTTVTPPPAPPAAPPPATPPAPPVPVGAGMSAVNDNIVFTDTSNDAMTWQRVRLLTILDLPRPEVLMNVWSYQASSPDGREIMRSADRVRDLVAAHNDALENSIQYGWAYLSHEMKGDLLNPGTPPPKDHHPFFDQDFYNYITQKFVADPRRLLPIRDRGRWGFCPAEKFCLGFTQAFQPLKPTLANILLGALASERPLATILTTIGCMEGKWEVYPECFPGRTGVSEALKLATVDRSLPKNDKRVTKGQGSVDPVTKDEIPVQQTCLRNVRRELVRVELLKEGRGKLSCELLDDVALTAQETCHVAQSFPLSCFTIEAVQSFSSYNSFSTFSLQDLNELAEVPLAKYPVIKDADTPKGQQPFGTTRIGLLRAAVADFLFNYKMAQEFPQDFTPYDLQHSAQELNAELNPLVGAFNQDVAALSRHLSNHLESGDPNRNHALQLWRNHKSFISDGIITVRGIGGYQSFVDTLTQNYFDATQAQSLSTVLNNLAGQGGSGTGSTPSPTAGALSALLQGGLNPTTAVAALAALTPPATQARIGRQLTFTVTPRTLPGASSAELDVQLIAGEDTPPNLYQAGNATGASDTLSRIARHNVTTKVRVESIKLFELSSFSALIQRSRNKFPLLPPFIEFPFIGNLASLPLPGAKEYHRSTAIVSAVIVPTAADLAYGIDFAHDRLITKETPTVWGHDYEMRSVSSLTQFQTQSERMPIRAFHKAIVNCFATNGGLTAPGGARNVSAERCSSLNFERVPPEF